MLVRCVLELLRRTGVAVSYVFNPSLSALEFIRYIAGDFGLPVAGKAKDDRATGGKPAVSPAQRALSASGIRLGQGQ